MRSRIAGARASGSPVVRTTRCDTPVGTHGHGTISSRPGAPRARQAVHVSGQRLEDLVALLPVDVVARRDEERRRRARLLDRHQSVGLGVGQRPEQHRVDEAEDRRVRADSDPQREDDDQAEARVPPEAPQGVLHVADDRLEHGKPRLVPERLLELRNAAELRAGEPAGLGGRVPGADVLRREQVEMHLDLLLRVPREPSPREEAPQAGDEHDDASPRAHGSGDSRRRRAMTPAMRSQSSVWAASRRRPAAVMA